jgi:hypothetical protein
MAAPRSETPNLREAQLFLDDAWIADSAKVGRVWHRGRKFPEPVLRADRPWERFGVCIFGTVLRREGMFQAWYTTWTRDSRGSVCYAESADGVTWVKPDLGLHEFEGARKNNICLSAPDAVIDNVSVIEDPDDAEWPLKAILWRGGKDAGLVAVRSRDGRQWDWTPGLVLPKWGDRTNAMARKDDSRYVVLGRAPGAAARHGLRLVSRTDSPDLVHWSRPRLVLKPDAEDGARMQFYSLTAFRYESMRLGFIERMYVTPDKVDCELAFSRDGVEWKRSRPRPSFIEWGLPGSWDDTWVNVGTAGPILHDGHLWFFYSGRSGAHGVPMPLNRGHVGVATLRVDGFASLQAKESPGWVETPPMRWPGGDLLVNVDCRRDLDGHPNALHGEVRVEARDGRGQPVDGYGREDCAPLRVNSARRGGPLYAPVRWAEGKRGLDELRRRQVRLVFHLQEAHLFAFKAG